MIENTTRLSIHFRALTQVGDAVKLILLQHDHAAGTVSNVHHNWIAAWRNVSKSCYIVGPDPQVLTHNFNWLWFTAPRNLNSHVIYYDYWFDSRPFTKLHSPRGFLPYFHQSRVPPLLLAAVVWYFLTCWWNSSMRASKSVAAYPWHCHNECVPLHLFQPWRRVNIVSRQTLWLTRIMTLAFELSPPPMISSTFECHPFDSEGQAATELCFNAVA